MSWARLSIFLAVAALEYGSDESNLFQIPRASIIEISSGSVERVYHVWCESPRIAPEIAGIQPPLQTLDISPSFNSKAPSPSPILSGDNSLSPLNLRLESSLRPPPVCDSQTPSCADNGSPAIPIKVQYIYLMHQRSS
jgi:hypothetical protein